MADIADIHRFVLRTVESDPVIRKGLQRGIINNQALARYIVQTNGREGNPETVLGVIRRYPRNSVNEDHRLAFKDCEIAVRSRIADLSIHHSPDVMGRIADYAATVKTTRGENLRVVAGARSIRVVADQKPLEVFRQTLSPNQVIKYSTGLGEISLLFSTAVEKIKGIVAKVTGQLALHQINLQGMMVCPPEDIMIISEDDIPRGLDALQQLLREETATYKPSLMSIKNSPRRPDYLITSPQGHYILPRKVG